MGLWLAVRFLTIFPAPGSGRGIASGAGASLPFFPLVGLGLGTVLVGLDYGLNYVLPQPIGNSLLLVSLVVMSGGHHLDGFIDTCDGAIGGRSPEERLAIMRDSRTGAFGVVGAVLLFLVKYAALGALADGFRPAALVLMPGLGRWAMVNAVFFFPYARLSGLGLVFKQGARWYWLAAATVIALGASVVILRLAGIALAIITLVITLAVGRYLRSRLGGLTGDCYGAIGELTEAAVLILIVSAQRWV